MNKTVSASRCVLTEIVLPNDTNGLGNMMGGRLMYLMDKCAAISAQRHAGGICVTAAVDSVEFRSPIRQNEFVIIESWVNRAFRTSMEVELNVIAEDPVTRDRRQSNRAFFTFVALAPDGTPRPVSPVEPETEDEHERYEHAARRREARLFFAGRLNLSDAQYIKDDFLAALNQE